MKHLTQAIFAKLQTLFPIGSCKFGDGLRFTGGSLLIITSIDKDVINFRLDVREADQSEDRAYRCCMNRHGAFDLDPAIYEADETSELYDIDFKQLPKLRRIIAEGLDIASEYYGNVTTQMMSPMPANCNPCNIDHVRGLVPLYGSTDAMFYTNGKNELSELVVVNARTGKRVEIDLSALND